MTIDIAIREWNSTDSIEELTDLLHRAYAPLGAMGLNFTAVDQPPEVTRMRIGYGQCFIALAGARIIGTVTVEPPYASCPCEYYRGTHVAAAHQFAVDPDFQRGGVGAQLLRRAEVWAAQQGFRELAIDTAAPASHLVEYYRKLGFEPVGRAQWRGKTYESVVLSKVLHLESQSGDRDD